MKSSRKKLLSMAIGLALVSSNSAYAQFTPTDTNYVAGTGSEVNVNIGNLQGNAQGEKGKNEVVIGDNSKITTIYPNVTTDNSIILGNNALVTFGNVVAIGNNAVVQKLPKSIDKQSNAETDTIVTSNDWNIIKEGTKSTLDHSVVIGNNAVVGANTDAETRDQLSPNVGGKFSVVVGDKASSGSDSGVVIGANASLNAGSINTIVIGSGDSVTEAARAEFNPRSVFIGSGVHSEGMFAQNLTAIGYKAIANNNNSVAIGAFSTDANYTSADQEATYFGSNYGGFFKNNVNKNEGNVDAWAGNTSAVVSIGGGEGYDISTGFNGSEKTVIPAFTRRLINLTAGKDDTDAVNVAQLKSLAANKISFLTDKGITDKVALGEVDTRDDDETRMQFSIRGVNGSGILTSADGKQINVGIDYSTAARELSMYFPAAPIVYTDGQNNKLVKIGPKYYKESDVAGKIRVNNGKFYKATDLDLNGNPINNAQGTEIADVPASDVYASGVGTDGNLTTPVKLTNLQSGLGLNNMPTANQNATAIGKDAALAATNSLLTKAGAELYNAATIGDLQAVAQGGLKFADGQINAGNIHAPLSSTIIIQGKKSTNYDANTYSADNLVTEAKDTGKTITISMKKSPEFTSVILGDNNNNVTLAADNHGNLALGGKKITGLSEGVADTDAVNMSQLNKLTKKIDNFKGGDGPSTVVYTNADGKIVEKANDGKFYPKEELAKYKLAKDGEYYLPAEVDADGNVITPQGGVAPTPQTLSGGVEADQVTLSTVNPDGTVTKPTSLGNLKSGLALSNMPNDAIANGMKLSPVNDDLSPNADAIGKARVAVAGADKNGKGGIYAIDGKALYNAATMGDLQAVAASGLTFTGNETISDTNKEIHRPMGTAVNIIGKKFADKNAFDTADVANNYSAENIATTVDKENNSLVINMKKNPDFTGVNLIKDNDPNTKVSMKYNDGNVVKFEGTGATDEEKLVTLSGLKDDPKDLTSAITRATFNTLADKVNNMNQEGGSAFAYVDKDGNKLVRDGDKFYKPAEIAGKVKAADGNYYEPNQINPDGSLAQGITDANKVQPITTELEKIKIVPVDAEGKVAKAMEIGHLKSGIGLSSANMPDDMTAQAGNVEQKEPINKDKAREIVAGPNKNGLNGGLYAINGNNLYKASTVGDLQAVAMSGLTFKADSTDKTDVIHRPLGTEISITTGDTKNAITDANKDKFTTANLGTKIDPTNNSIVVEMKKDIAIDTVTIGGNQDAANNTKLGVDKDGNLIINPKAPANAGEPFAESETPKEIRGLAKGTQEDSAVNVKQLNSSLDDLNNRINYLNEGSAGNVVYTDDEGERVTPVRKDGQTTYYYIKDIVGAGLKQVVEIQPDGSEERAYYKKAEYDAWKNGGGNTTKPNPVNIATELNGKEVSETKITLSTVNGDGSTKNPESLSNIASALNLSNMKIEKGIADNVDDVAGKVKAAKGFKPVVAGADGKVVANTADDTVAGASKNIDSARKVVAGDNMDGMGGIYAAEGRDLYKATTLGDLQAVAAAGLTFAGNETISDNTKAIHRPMGTAVNIIGKKFKDKNEFDAADIANNYSAENIATTVDKDSNSLVINMKKNPDFTGVNLIKETKNPDGTIVASGKVNMTYGDGDKVIFSAGTDKDPTQNNKPVVLTGLKDDVNDPNSAITNRGVQDAIRNQSTFQYVDANGAPLVKEGDKFYTAASLKGLKKASDGNYYPEAKVNDNGTIKPEANGQNPQAAKLAPLTADELKNVAVAPISPSENADDSRMVIRNVKEDPNDLDSAITRRSLQGIGNRIDEVEKWANAGTAAALASGNIPQVLNTNQRSAFGIGLGNYRGEKAIAFGITGVNRKRTTVYKVTGTYDSTSTFGIGAGISFAFGKQDKLEDVMKEDRILYPGELNARIMKQEEEMSSMKNYIQDLQNTIQSLMSEIKDLKAAK